MKKNISIFIILLLSICAFADGDITCNIEIASSETTIDGTDINPGDVICLLYGNKDFLLMNNIHGTESQPVTIINKDGAVVINTDHFYGIKFNNCSHVIFSGNGSSSDNYGIQVTRVGQGTGISIDNKSTNIEIEYVEVSYTAIAGIYAKTDPYQGDCDNLVTRSNFTMYNLIIHDCYIHDVADEGMYIGSSKFTGQTVYSCDDIVVLPHVIEGVEVYNNIVENTGWDGIQVSSATSDCFIHDNIIRNDSWAEEWGQMSGILIGSGSQCDCYNNKIFDGYGDGIDVFGMGNMMIYNNLIVNAGINYEPSNKLLYRHGIYIGLVEDAFTSGANFKVYANTIIGPKSFGITFNNSLASTSNFQNNLITNPGIWEDYEYFNTMVGTSTTNVSNNYFATTTSEALFIDSSQEDYDLKPNSPAINIGTSLTNEGITFDIEGRFRPFHTYFDAGAYECHDPYADINETSEKSMPYPIPATNYLTIPIREKEIFTIRIISLSGEIVAEKHYNKQFSSKVKIDINNIARGNYIINYHDHNTSVNWPVIIN